jgi:two-component system response regulator MprA
MKTNTENEAVADQAAADPVEEAGRPDTAACVAQPATILVVDDDADVRVTIRSILNAFGFCVMEAVDGVDALERMKQRLPDLLVTDIQMPHMNGYQLMMQARNRWPQLPIVMISGFANSEHAMAGRKSPGVDYLEKPSCSPGTTCTPA